MLQNQLPLLSFPNPVCDYSLPLPFLKSPTIAKKIINFRAERKSGIIRSIPSYLQTQCSSVVVSKGGREIQF